ncbi:Uncharacterised protein [Halioglobus japonicus]|nr:Uncharacterised protein [Halioglobus japonicus]
MPAYNFKGSTGCAMNEPPENGNEGNDEAANELVTPAMRLLDLQKKHRALDSKIDELHSYPYQNQILLQRLKKEKLLLKDAITRLKDEMIPDLNA